LSSSILDLERQFQLAQTIAMTRLDQQVATIAEAKNREIVLMHQPSTVVRMVNGAIVTADIAVRAYQVAKLAKLISQRRRNTITYQYSYADDVVQFALQTLRERSPVGSGNDPHPGLYRDSHMVFIDGRRMPDGKSWRPGQTIHISNPEPYSRKIESGDMKMKVPGHVYEMAEPIVTARFGNRFSIKFVFMPVTHGSNQSWADNTSMQRAGRKLSPKARADWLVRQPALQITAR
jgi:hypothetical protein